MKKETKKKVGSIIVAGTMLLGSNLVLSSNNYVEAQGINTNQNKEITVIYNGEKLEFDQEPIIENGRTKVPFRKIFESMGTIVYYNNTESSILGLTKTGDIITHKIGTNKATINGEEKEYDSSSTIQNGRTLVPVRMISDLLGADVEWIEKDRIVEIEKEEEQIDSTRKDVMNHVLDVNYNPKDTNRYVEYKKKHPEISTEQAIIDVNMDLDRELVLTVGNGVGQYAGLTHYEAKKEEVELLENPNEFFVYVNKFNKFADDYEPSNIVNHSPYKYGSGYYKFREELIEPINMLINEAQSQGFKMEIDKSYENEIWAKSSFNQLISSKRLDSCDEAYAYNRFPKGEMSELRTGLSVIFNADANTLEERLLDMYERGILRSTDEKDYIDSENDILNNKNSEQWLRENAYKYGFIERYPKNKAQYTRYEYSPNFYRYVGLDVSTKMHDDDLCFDEYYAKYLNPIVNDSNYSIDEESTQKVLKKH